MANPIGLQQILRTQGIQWGDSGRSGNDFHLWFGGDGSLYTDAVWATQGGMVQTAPASWGSTGGVSAGWANFNSTITGAQTTEGKAAQSTITFSGLTADYAGTIAAWDATTNTDTSTVNYTGILRGGMGHVNIQTTGTATAAFVEGLAGVVNVKAGAAGTLTAGYGTAGELIMGSTGYTVTTFNGVQGVVGSITNNTLTDPRGVYGLAQTYANSGATVTRPVGGYFFMQHTDATTIGTAKGSENWINLNDAGLGGIITNAWATHSHVDTQTTTTGTLTNTIVHNVVLNHAAAGTITLALGLQIQLNQTHASGVVTAAEGIRIASPSISNSIPANRGLRVNNIGNSHVTTSEAIRIDAQSGSTGTNFALNVLGGVVAITGEIIKNHSPVAINSTATATAAQVATGYITSTSAAPTTITLPTGTALGTQLAATQGTVFDLVIDNTAGASTVTIAVAVNGILSALAAAEGAGSGLLTIPSGVTGQGCYRLMFSSATAYTFSRIA